MIEDFKRFLFLCEYDSIKDKNSINDNIDFLLESKKTEQEANNILLKNNFSKGNVDDIIRDLKNGDTTKNQILLPVMSRYLSDVVKDSNQYGRYLEETIKLFKIVSNYVNVGKLKTPQLIKDKIVIDGKSFDNTSSFADYINTIEDMDSGYESDNVNAYSGNEEPLMTGDNIEIYDGNDVGKCIKYTTGGLNGRQYNFCIGRAGSNMWQTYRDTKTSTFYFILDKNRDYEDPLHIVVVDVTKDGVELTDNDNKTTNISEYGNDYESYFKYLNSKGIDTKIFKNIPKTYDENKEESKLGKENGDLDWFKKLSFSEKSKYIGRGNKLSHKQFNWLWQYKNNKGAFSLLTQYLDTGKPIDPDQINILTDGFEDKRQKELIITYYRKRNLTSNQTKLQSYELNNFAFENNLIDVNKLPNIDVNNILYYRTELITHFKNRIKDVDLDNVYDILYKNPETIGYFKDRLKELKSSEVNKLLYSHPQLKYYFQDKI